MLMSPTADGKKLLRWCEVLVLMDRSLLPEGSGTRSLCPGWEGSAIIFPARLRVYVGKESKGKQDEGHTLSVCDELDIVTVHDTTRHMTSFFCHPP